MSVHFNKISYISICTSQVLVSTTTTVDCTKGSFRRAARGGFASWLVWRTAGFRGARGALTLYVAQLVPNALWSWLFFAWNLGAVAFADILLLWVLIVLTTIAFWRVRPAAGWLLIPYLLWVTFAAALNYTLWQLNPQILG